MAQTAEYDIGEPLAESSDDEASGDKEGGEDEPSDVILEAAKGIGEGEGVSRCKGSECDECDGAHGESFSDNTSNRCKEDCKKVPSFDGESMGSRAEPKEDTNGKCYEDAHSATIIWLLFLSRKPKRVRRVFICTFSSSI